LEKLWIKNDSRTLAVLLVIFSLISSGCAYQLGKTIDERAPNYKIVERYDYYNIEINSDIIIYQKDHSTINGKLFESNVEYIALETKFGKEIVNMEDIATIEVRSKKNAMKIGIGIDVALYIAFTIWYGDGSW